MAYPLLLALAAIASAAEERRGYPHHASRVADFHLQVPRQLRHQVAHISTFSDSTAADARVRVRVKPEDFGADPTGVRDSTSALQDAVNVCVQRAKVSPNGVFPGDEDNWGPVGDAGGCLVDLDGGEYRISRSIQIPELVANMQLGHGSIVADAKNFTQDGFLLVVGVKGSCKVPQGSCNMDLNFPDLFLSGSNVANAMQVNNVMGVTVGPGGYFLNFTSYGVQINDGHEVMMDRCWLGETNFDYKFAAHGNTPKATAIEINGNDHYILNTIVFSSKVGVAVHGAATVITGVHVWFPVNQALAFNDTKAFHITEARNRFTGCYADGGRVLFEGSGLQHNFWTGGFECCAGSGLMQVPHGIILRGDKIGPGLNIFNNLFNGGNIWHEPSSPGKVPTVTDVRFTENSGALTSRATQTLAQKQATTWHFKFCQQLAIPHIVSAQVSLQAQAGFPRYIVRPIQNCSVLVETDEAVTGSMTVNVDVSSYSASPAAAGASVSEASGFLV
eukprot:TRINITY_DN124023_c0_g1_i1.p1 TRINITY_DN124023_c0_g1~~TRINITY_DN124023_c0_g1_i1.p1  ORF type:complete len:503 (+),score=54.08 TRINITY_DN124023_c0_g1_i1:52-1560(+)